MNKTKKSLLALLLTSMVTIGLAGCSQTDSTKTAAATSTTNTNTNLQLNNNSGQTDASKTGDQSKQNPNAGQDPNANEPAIQEVRKAFNIGSEYMTITMPTISSIALGKF